ncbi:hypothetical protein [Methylobacterium iners]|uniref:Uncharacterized protein n=1 Tax=Methylobacterium iners TaxID=418707 RepID=A0ABQ4RT65_9HYPH|nr:hypothetical protein [Methylobacterium iners]GJD93394.1 hypothetical protein OCOJLMKI_0588 [Methylobacterium iners]
MRAPPHQDSALAALAAAAAAAAPVIRAAVTDCRDGSTITGEITAELSDTHVRLRCDDGLVFAVPKAALVFLPIERSAR